MAETDDWTCLVENLYEYHLFASAETLIEKAPLDRLRLLPKIRKIHAARKLPGHQLQPGAYFLVTCPLEADASNPRETGLVLPLTVGSSMGKENPFRLDDAARSAIEQAAGAARTYFQVPWLPKLHCRFPDFFNFNNLHGSSLGLAVALAFVQTHSRRPYPAPVLATGEITENMNVHQVDQITVKVQAAFRELGDGDGIILVPRTPMPLPSKENTNVRLVQVSSLQEAVLAVWGQDVAIHQEFADLENFLDQLRKSTDFRENIGVIAKRLQRALPPMDRLHLLCELMVQHRHLGDMNEADALRRQLETEMQRESENIDIMSRQEVEVQILSTQLDLFPGSWFRDRCEAMLKTRLFDMHNEIRVRGMLAKFESMNGRSARSIALRQENLQAHERRSNLQAEKPFTLCHLVWECARAGNSALFDAYADRLAQATASDNVIQWAYNYHAMVAGSLLLRRHEALWKFLQSSSCTYLGAGTPLREFFLSNKPVESHPEISTLRALIRLCRKMGQPHEAVRLGRRFHITAQPGNLLMWLFVACGIERDLAWHEQDGSGMESIRAAADLLQFCHQPATAFHSSLAQACRNFDGSPAAVTRLERELDNLYY